MVLLFDIITYCMSVCLCCIGCFFVVFVLFVFTHYPECVLCFMCFVLMLYGYKCYICVLPLVGIYHCLLTKIIIISKDQYCFEYGAGKTILYIGVCLN